MFRTLALRASMLPLIAGAASLVALTFVSTPAYAGKDCESFTLSAGSATLSGNQSRLIPGRRARPGTVLHVRGTYVEFDVNLDTFAVLNYTLTGAPGRDQITSVRTTVFESKVPEHGVLLTGPIFVSMNGSQLVLQRTGSGMSMKVQAKDCDNGGLFQMEPEPGTRERNQLAPAFRYFERDTASGRVFFTDGVVLGYDSPEVATQVIAESTTRVNVWSVTGGGRIGMVVGEDAQNAYDAARAGGTLVPVF